MTKRLSQLFSIVYTALTTLNVCNTYYAYVEAPKIWGHRKGFLNLYESPILESFKTNYNDILVISFNAISALMAIAALYHCFFRK